MTAQTHHEQIRRDHRIGYDALFADTIPADTIPADTIPAVADTVAVTAADGEIPGQLSIDDIASAADGIGSDLSNVTESGVSA